MCVGPETSATPIKWTACTMRGKAMTVVRERERERVRERESKCRNEEGEVSERENKIVSVLQSECVTHSTRREREREREEFFCRHSLVTSLSAAGQLC